MDKDAWRAMFHGVAKSQTRPSDWTELNQKFGEMLIGAGQSTLRVVEENACLCSLHAIAGDRW